MPWIHNNVIEVTFAPKEIGEETDAEFLRDLAERLQQLAPNIIGTDQYHVQRLHEIAEIVARFEEG